MILSQYNYNPMLTNMDMTEASHRSQDPLDYSGLKHRTLRFTPKAALRTDSPDPPTMGKPTDRFIAVDYQLLQQAWRNLEAKKHAPPQVDGSVEAVRAAEERARTAEAQARNTESLVSGGGNPQEATGIHSETTRQPAHRTSQPQVESHIAAKLKARKSELESDGSKASAFAGLPSRMLKGHPTRPQANRNRRRTSGVR